MTKEQVLMYEYILLKEATEWGSGSEVVFYGFCSGLEALIGKILEVMTDEENTACMD